jgi:hypothetical protein
MDAEKKERLEKAGFRVGSVAEFLDLTPEEQEKVENMVFINRKPVGICECNGQGKGNCKGNGWIKDGSGYQKCPYFSELS